MAILRVSRLVEAVAAQAESADKIRTKIALLESYSTFIAAVRVGNEDILFDIPDVLPNLLRCLRLRLVSTAPTNRVCLVILSTINTISHLLQSDEGAMVRTTCLNAGILTIIHDLIVSLHNHSPDIASSCINIISQVCLLLLHLLDDTSLLIQYKYLLISVLVTCLRNDTMKSDSKLVANVANTLWILVNNRAMNVSAGTHGIVEALAECLERHAKDPSAAQWICACLARLALVSDNKKRISDLRVTVLVKACLVTFRDTRFHDVLTQACAVITNTSDVTEFGADDLTVLCEIVRAHRNTSAPLVASAFRALQNASNQSAPRRHLIDKENVIAFAHRVFAHAHGRVRMRSPLCGCISRHTQC